MKGLALVGAVAEIADAGYTFPRIAGSSVGALAGSVLAALQVAGEPVSRIADVLLTLDLRRVRSVDGPERFLPLVGPLVSLLRDEGMYSSVYLRDWLRGVLGDLGVHTFGDLRLPPEQSTWLPPERRYGLVVTASDVSRRRLVRLPWDAALYGLDPDELRVDRAVRASTAIPLYFEPVRLRSAEGATSTLVDGGLLSNFPVTIFDVPLRQRPAWPTFGVRLAASPALPPPQRTVRDPLSLALALVDTFLSASDAPYAFDDCVLRRTVFVDTGDVSAVNFDLSEERQADLVRRGRRAARQFLAGWDLDTYLEDCRRLPNG